MGGNSNWVPMGSSGKGGSSGGGSSNWVPMGAKSAQAPAPHKGGGILGGIESAAGWVGSKASLAGHDIEQMPGGLVQVAKVGFVDPAKATYETLAGHKKAFNRTMQQEDRLSRGLAQGTKQQLVQSAEHPLRDPFATGLTFAPAIGMAGRLGEAGLAAREAAAVGDESAAAAAAKALTRTHGNEPPRVLKSGGRLVKRGDATMRIGGKDTNLIPSRNAGVRFFAQRPYDKIVQGALDKEAQAQGTGRVTARIAEHGKARAGGALAEEQRAVQRMNSVPADRLERSALRLSKLPLKAGGKIHSAAMELTSTQTPPEVAALYHEQQAVKLSERAGAATDPKVAQSLKDAAKRNEGAAALYRKVGENDLVRVDHSRPDGQKVFINPAKTNLAHADAALAHAGSAGEQMIAEHNLMSPQGQVDRINAPARVRSGAEYTPATPGKLGVPSHVFKEAQSQVAKLEKLHARAAIKAMGDTRNSRSVMNQFAQRQMTPEEAQARLAELDRQHKEMTEKLVPEVSPHTSGTSSNGRRYSPEQMRRNFESGKSGKKLETVAQENARLADEKMREIAQKHAGVPWADALNKMLRERDALRQALQSHADAAIFGHEPSPLPNVAGSGYPYAMPWEHSPVVQRISSALSVAKDRLEKLQTAHDNRVQPTGLIGGESALPGRTFTGYRTSEKVAQPSPVSASRGGTIGEAQSPIDAKHFTGENIRQGNIPKNVALAGARHYRQIAKFVNTDSLRRSILEHDGSMVKRSPRDILIRVPDAGAKPLTEEMKQSIGVARSAVHDQASLDEANAGTQEGLRALHQFFANRILDKAEASKAAALGMRADPGYRWVDGKLAGELQKDAAGPATGIKSLPGKMMDNTNSAVTALTVYFKVGHVFTRTLTNAATNMIQGSLRPDEFHKSINLWKELTPEEQARALGAAGQQGFAALPHEGSEGMVGRGVSAAARGGARFWARHADAPFRFNSLAYELRKVGYDSPDKFRSALDAIQRNGKGMPAHEWSKVSAAFRRADREAISYDRLGPFEKAFMTRAIWFYPWVKGSSFFTVRSILEHPWKSSALGNLGVQGRREQLQELGPVPSYEQGLIALGGGKSPETVDMSTFSPAATLGNLLNIPSVKGSIAQLSNPVLGSAMQYAMGVNQYGEPSNSPFSDAAQALIAPTPAAQIADSFRRQGQDTSGRMFPGMTPGAELKRYFLGPGLAERRVNKAALPKAAAREKAKRYTVYGK